MKNRFFLFLLVVLLGSITVHVNAATDSLLTILTVEDPTPKAKPLSQQVFTGNNPAADCSYYELLQQAKNTARTLGANVVKINKHKKRSQGQFCDEINVSFYLVDDIRTVEKHFPWSALRPLVWDDFKGSVPGNAPGTNAAVTSCGIAIETNSVTMSGPVKVYVFNSFETSTSWVKPEQQKHAVLMHEQGHFDLCELYTRKMRERFASATINYKNLQQMVQSIYNTTMHEYEQRQADYEHETQHGVEEIPQQEWTERIAKELAPLDGWASK